MAVRSCLVLAKSKHAILSFSVVLVVSHHGQARAELGLLRGWDLQHEGVGTTASPCTGALSHGTLASPTGHVFPEFKESDAMFAAERVSSAAGHISLSCPVPAKPSALTFLHSTQIRGLAGCVMLQLSHGQFLGSCTAV